VSPPAASGAEAPDPAVLVVGAGPTGLALAAQLDAFGARARVVERRVRDQPSRAFVVQPRTLEVLAPAGISAALVARGDASARATLHARGREATVSMAQPGVADTAYPFLLAIPQVEVERALEEHLAGRGVVVERGVTLRTVRADARGALSELRHADGRTELARSQFVVGCDGADSTVRRQAGIAFSARPYRPTLLLADVELDGDLDPGALHGIVAPAGALFLFPFPGGRAWRLLTVLERRDLARGEAAVVEEAVARASGGALAVRRLLWAQRVRLRRAQAATYRRGRVLLAGDAAHVHSPAGAQGMNSGLQDAVNLGWKLALVASGWARPALLDTYGAERRPVNRWTRRLTDVAFFVEACDVPPLGRLRRALAPALVPLADGRSMPAPAFRLIAGLWTGYGRSSIAEEGEPRLRGGARPGHRLPDGLVVEPRGRRARLHDRLRPPGFHLLVCDTGRRDRPPPPPVVAVGPLPLSVHRISSIASPSALLDPGGRLRRRLGVTGSGAVLVRPDGYIGYRCAGASLAGVAAHLAAYREGPPHDQSAPRCR
jgi:2-polyprenyl-6-methoxyphenol hydroxylase-like FAD-dependent oxidoreductase